MVTSKEQARQHIRDVMLKIMDLPVFEEKLDVINTLTDLDWKLREPELEQENDICDEDIFRGGMENPWGD